MMINHEVIRYILLLLNCDFFHIKQCIPLHVNVLTFTDFICMELYESRAQLLRGTIRMPSYNNIVVMMAAVAVQARGKPGLYHSMMMPWHRKAFYPNGTLLPVDSPHGVNFHILNFVCKRKFTFGVFWNAVMLTRTKIESISWLLMEHRRLEIMMTPSSWNISLVTDLCLNKQWCKQPRRQWFETPSPSLWRHCNDISSRKIYSLTLSGIF